MAKDDDIVWLMVYHPLTDCVMALPCWKYSPSLARVLEAGAKFEFVDKETAHRHNASLGEFSLNPLDEQLTSRWEIIAEQRKGKVLPWPS